MADSKYTPEEEKQIEMNAEARYRAVKRLREEDKWDGKTERRTPWDGKTERRKKQNSDDKKKKSIWD